MNLKNEPKPDGFMTIRDAADRLALNPETLRRWDRKGTITAYRTPGGYRRFLESDIDAIFRKMLEEQ